MTDFTAEAPVRANKATPKAKASHSPAAVPQKPAAPAPVEAAPQATQEGPTADELLVADTIRQQVMAIYDGRSLDLSGACDELLHATVEALELRGGAFVGFYRALALLAGATAIEIQSNPGSPAIQVLEGMRQTLDTVAASYDTHFDACEPVAEGIRAGMRQQRAQSTSQARRVKLGDSPYSEPQLRSVLSEIASVALSLDRVLLIAQNAQEDSDVTALIDTAEILARQLGGMADGAIGGDVYGTQDKWTYGPNFADLGKAGAA